MEILIAEARAAGVSLADCDVLSFRNNLNKLLGTAVDQRDPWKFDACAYAGTLFLDILKEVQQEWITSERGQLLSAWGYQFEARCTGGIVGKPNSEYGMLVRTRLGNSLRMFIGAEIDAYDPAAVGTSADGEADALPPLSALRELKTYMEPLHRGQWRTLYALKHPKWWIQSFLAGVTALVLGQRDDEGIVGAIHHVQIRDLPKLSWQHGERWNPQQILAFGAEVLAWIQSVAMQHPEQQVRVSFDPETGMIGARVVPGGDLPGRLRMALKLDATEAVAE